MVSQPKTGQSASLVQVQLPSTQSRRQTPAAGVVTPSLPGHCETAMSQYWLTEPTGAQSASDQQLAPLEPELPLEPVLPMEPELLPVLTLVDVEPVPDVDVVPPAAVVADVPVELDPPSPGLVKQPVNPAKASEARTRARVGMAHPSASAMPRAIGPRHWDASTRGPQESGSGEGFSKGGQAVGRPAARFLCRTTLGYSRMPMYPVLFYVGSHPVTSYGTAFGIGTLLLIVILRHLARVYALPASKLYDLAFWAIMAAFSGARLLFVIVNRTYFAAHPWQVFAISDGGLDFLGAPLFGAPVVCLYARWQKLPIAASLDILLASLSGVHVIGRLGCFFAGCCHGRATDMPWGVRFTSGAVDPALRGVPVHPTQLYEAFCELVLFTVLIRLAPRRRFDGQLALTYALSYSVIRFVIEFFRGDPVRGFVFGVLSTSQFLSLLIFACAATALAIILRRSPSTPVAALPSP